MKNNRIKEKRATGYRLLFRGKSFCCARYLLRAGLTAHKPGIETQEN